MSEELDALKVLIMSSTTIFNTKEQIDESIKTIKKALKDYEQCEEILNDYGLTLVNFREACLLLAMLKGNGRNIHNIDKQLKALEITKELFGFDFALRYPNNQPMLMITNNLTFDYWEMPISKEKYEILKEVLL